MSVDNSLDTTQNTAEETKVSETEGGRRLGTEWSSWNGSKDNWDVDSPESVFLWFAAGVMGLVDAGVLLFYYLIAPRLEYMHPVLPSLVFGLSWCVVGYLACWYAILLVSSYTSVKMSFAARGHRFLLGFLLDKVFQLGNLLKYNRDKIGNSFLKVSNAFTRSIKRPGTQEKLLILLPRCLTQNTYKTIRSIVSEFNIEMSICTGGEAARKKVKEYRPTAVIGIACERDLVSGIKDVGGKISVLGVPNIRPDGPCKNTLINFEDFRNSIKFYLSAVELS